MKCLARRKISIAKIMNLMDCIQEKGGVFFMGCLKRIEIGLEFPGLHPLRTNRM